MDQERWQRIEELMQGALDLESGERAAFLERECGGDNALAREVERLLALGDEEFSLIEQPVIEIAAAMLGAPEPDERTGQRFGRYEIGELLGTGGMGEVYLARDTQLGRNVALKLLPSDYTADPERVRRFQQEARAASALNHPNIITIHEIGEHDGAQFIAVEYIEGETLRRRMARGRLGPGEALEIAVQAAGALAAAHRAGIIHRDVKPENIMLRPDGYVKVLDFGLAKLVEQAAPADLAESTPGVVMGTVRYMSPEQARAKALDASTDVFSLGVVLYEMVAGRRPFEGETATDVLAEILKSDPEPIADLVPGAPEALDLLLGRALAKRRDDRYGSAGELLADLRSLAKELDLQAEWTRLQTASGGERALATSGIRAAARTVEQSSTWQRVRDVTSTGLQTAFSTTRRGAVSSVLMLGAMLAPATIVYQKTRVVVPFEHVTITPLGAGEGFGFSTISPDGTRIVEARESKSGVGVGLWSKERATGESIHLADTRWFLHQPVFTPDSSYVYYNDAEFDGPNGEEPTAIVAFRIPALGGEPQEILKEPWSNLGVSPDGARIAYARLGDEKQTTSLCVANADGSNERVIATHAEPDLFSRGGPAWSPDGTLVACGTTTGLVLVPADGGEERPFATEAFRVVHRVVWPKAGGGMIVSAGEKEVGYQIFYLSYPELVPRRITSDPENYEALSVTDDATTLVSTQYGRMSNLWVAPNGDPRQGRQITSGKFHRFAKVRWTPDGRLLAPANTTGTRELWIMDADGSHRQQLTTGMNVRVPAATPDGRYALFTSIDSDNVYSVWRIGLDGSDPVRLAEGHSPDCSADGWVYFMGTGESGAGLRKIRIEGGAPVPVTELFAGPATVSKDGLLLLCTYARQAGGPFKTGVFSAETGRLVKTVEEGAAWSPDGRGWLTGGPDGAPGIWVRPFDGGAPYKVAELPNGVGSYELSADGTLVYVVGNDYADNVEIAGVE